MSKIVVYSLLLLSCLAGYVQSKPFTVLQMFENVIQDLPDDNVLVCPSAIDQSLIQLYLAGKDATEAELRTVLAINGSSKESIYETPLPSWATAQDPSAFKIASRFYARKGLQIQSTFTKNHAKYLNTEIENVDDNDKWPEVVNKWVNSNTDQKLEELIDPLQFEVPRKLFLASTLSFSASWKIPFKPMADALFYIPDESRSVSVKMMQLVDNLKYSFEKSINCHTVVIPLSIDDLDMVLMIPKNFDGIDKIEQDLNFIDLNKTAVTKVALSLPQFNFRYSRDMVQTLINLGVDEGVFTNTNLGDLVSNNERFKIDSMMHSSIINVDAEGVKSSFATGVEVLSSKQRTIYTRSRSPLAKGRKKGSPSPTKALSSVSVDVNRPFLFSIRDSNTTYFFGRYSNPSWT